MSLIPLYYCDLCAFSFTAPSKKIINLIEEGKRREDLSCPRCGCKDFELLETNKKEIANDSIKI